MFRSFSDPVDEDDFWNDLIAVSDKIYKSTGEKDFAKKIILATIDEIEKISKEKISENV